MTKRGTKRWTLAGAVLSASFPALSFAAATPGSPAALLGGGSGPGGGPSPTWLLVVAGASLLPFLLLMLTSFVKIAVVLSILKSAIGGSQVPPSSIVTGLAMILTVYVMAPTGQRMYDALRSPRGTVGAISARAADGRREAEGVAAILDVVDRVKEPMRDFLQKHADPRERATFAALAVEMGGAAPRAPTSERDFLVLAPAFVTSELRRGFEIGFLLFVPFLVLDLVIATLLTALGMPSLSPTAVSLPFKLLLFVLIDGWHLVARGLVESYL